VKTRGRESGLFFVRTPVARAFPLFLSLLALSLPRSFGFIRAEDTQSRMRAYSRNVLLQSPNVSDITVGLKKIQKTTFVF
jgi:hypothetical protein